MIFCEALTTDARVDVVIGSVVEVIPDCVVAVAGRAVEFGTATVDVVSGAPMGFVGLE